MSGNQLIGTPFFMAPEQVSNPKAVDHRADVFALGSVMYYALAGRKPFEAETLAECLFKVVKDDPPPLAKIRPEIPKRLVAVIQKLMTKDLKRRFQTAGEVVKVLRQIR